MKKALMLLALVAMVSITFSSCENQINEQIQEEITLKVIEKAIIKDSPNIVAAHIDYVKDDQGATEMLIVRTKCFLPKDSKVITSGEGEVADNVYYRPLTITYDGTSSDFDYFDVDFTIDRKDIGLLERGANVKVKSAVVVAQSIDGAVLRDPQGEETGTTVEYEDEQNLP